MHWKHARLALVAMTTLGVMAAACDDDGGDETASPTEPQAVEPTSTVPAATEPAATEAAAGTTIDVTAPSVAYDPESIEAPAGETFTVVFTNEDSLPHNFAIFDSEDAASSGEEPIAATEIASGPDTQELAVQPLEQGEYFVWCQVHTSAMTATLVVQ